MISPGEECRSWDASRLAHTVWLCENDGRMGWGGSAGLQLVKAHVKGHLSAQGVWAEHLQLCFLILGCSKLSRKEKKWEKLPQVTVTYSVKIFSLSWRLSKLLSLEGGAAVVVAVRCWFPDWDLKQMKPCGSNQPIDEWACWDVWTPPPLSKILQESAEIQSITTSRINTQTCHSCPAFLLSLQLFSPRMSNQYTELVKNSKFPEKKSELLFVVLICWVYWHIYCYSAPVKIKFYYVSAS